MKKNKCDLAAQKEFFSFDDIFRIVGSIEQIFYKELSKKRLRPSEKMGKLFIKKSIRR